MGRAPHPLRSRKSVSLIAVSSGGQSRGFHGICSLASLSPLFHVPLDLGYAAQSAALPLTRKQETGSCPLVSAPADCTRGTAALGFIDRKARWYGALPPPHQPPATSRKQESGSAYRPQPVRAERGPGAALSPLVLRAWCHALPRMRAFSLPASPLPVCSRMGRASRPRRASPGVIGALGR